MLVGPARAWAGASGGGPVDPEDMPLVQAEHFEFVGAFRVPSRGAGLTDTFAFGGGAAMSINPNGTGGQKTLILGGRTDTMTVAEISIPAPDPVSGRTSLPVATLLQGFHDPSEGDYEDIYPAPKDSYPIVGTLVRGASLLTSYTIFYGSQNNLSSITVSSTNFSTAGHQGPLTFDTTGHMLASLDEYGQKWFAGPMCHLPSEWQSRLGGKALVGSAERSTTQRNSVGPAATVFDPADVGVVDPIPCKPLLGYFERVTDVPTTGPLPFPDFHLGCRIDGIAVPKGTRTFMAVGRYGTGSLTGFVGAGNNEACYGIGTSDPSYINNPDNLNYCYSLASSNHTFHAYPYKREAWLYDMLDLEDVKNGVKRHDAIYPYARVHIPWPEHLDFDDNCQLACAIDNDVTPPRIYFAMLGSDENESPLIAVFDIVTGGG